jgi:type VI secretion system protein ImpH
MLSLHAALERAPHRFGFFSALRRLQQAAPERPRIGSSARPSDDLLRLSQPPSLAFAASTLAAFECRDGKPPRLEVNFLGLFGPNGPLPSHITEYAHERAHNAGDPSLARFADIFHHRMLSLFFRAWAMPQPVVDMDRPASSHYVGQIGSLIGIGRAALRARDAMPDEAKLHYAGHLANQTRHPEGLQAMVRDLFGLPATIEEFVGEWMSLPENAQARLGGTQDTSRLGVDMLAGTRTWCAQHKFRLRLGPMSWDEYRQFLPGEDALARLRAVVRNAIGGEWQWELALVLKSPEVPTARLGEAHRLGWSTWLGERADPLDASDLRLEPSLSPQSARSR